MPIIGLMDKEVLVSHTMEYYSAIIILKKDEILPFAAAWMDLKGVMLNERKSDGEE